MIRKKRDAVQKFLKKDIADLLRSALDYNAYERAEGLLCEQNMSSCYELVAKFASCISGHIQDLCKQSTDCPTECKEAMGSLIHAAARFSDLPELRELRTLFTNKFGNSLESYISKEFVNKLRQDPPSEEMKMQLLRDLAQEFSIEWNSKILEERLNSLTHLHKEKAKHDQVNEHDHKDNDPVIPKIDRQIIGGKQIGGRDYLTSKGNENDTLSQAKKNTCNVYWGQQTTDHSSLYGHKACSSLIESVSEYEAEVKRPFSYKFVSPPYVKEKLNKGGGNLNKTTEYQALPLKKESNHDIDEPHVPKKPIPRSVRQRPLKSPPSYNNSVSYPKTGGSAKVHLSEKESNKAKQHQQTRGDSNDDEERMMDKLLMHYSKKQLTHDN